MTNKSEHNQFINDALNSISKEEMDQIVQEVDAMNIEGPTFDDYLRNFESNYYGIFDTIEHGEKNDISSNPISLGTTFNYDFASTSREDGVKTIFQLKNTQHLKGASYLGYPFDSSLMYQLTDIFFTLLPNKLENRNYRFKPSEERA